MSINWVMLDSNTRDFVKLPREQLLISSPPRTSLSLKGPGSAPAQAPLPLNCNDGRAIITNQRIIYLPSSPSPEFQSLAAPILSLQDTRVAAPFFGPNTWEAMLIPTAGGGFSSQTQYMQLKLTFKEGGAFDFHSTFENIKERANQAAETARESRSSNGPNHTAPLDIDLEPLPAYDGPPAGSTEHSNHSRVTATGFPDEKAGSSILDSSPASEAPTGPPPNITTTQPAEVHAQPAPIRPNLSPNETTPISLVDVTTRPTSGPPNEPPPGYEEVQSRTVADTLEERLRGQIERDGNIP